MVSRTFPDYGRTVVVVGEEAEEAVEVEMPLQAWRLPEHRAQDEVALLERLPPEPRPQDEVALPELLPLERRVQGAVALPERLPPELPQLVLLPEHRVAVVVVLRARLLQTLPVYLTPHLAMPAAEFREACPFSHGLWS